MLCDDSTPKYASKRQLTFNRYVGAEVLARLRGGATMPVVRGSDVAIFISYRRGPSSAIAGRIDDRLREHFGKDGVFRDVDNIPPGEDFRQIISDAVQRCDVLLAVVGPDYLGERINAETDFVRLELEAAFARHRCVIPVLVAGASLPSPSSLPDCVAPIVYRNGVGLDVDRGFEDDIKFLIVSIERARQHIQEVSGKPCEPKSKRRIAFATLGGATLLAIASALLLLARRHDQPGANPDALPVAMWSIDGGPDVSQPASTDRAPDASKPITAAKRDGTSGPKETTRLLTVSQTVPKCAKNQVLIRGGQFTMGDDDHPDNRSKPQHRVALSPYCIDRTEVTAGKYKDCVNGGGCNKPEDKGSQCTFGKDELRQHPMNCVTWFEARDYCQKQGARLPTEAEWEFAARGTDGRRYPWGNQAPTPSRLNMHGNEDSWEYTAPVGSFSSGKSYFGVLDMAGNVSEWTADAAGQYESRDDANPFTYGGADTLHVFRGGSWKSEAASWFRVADRDWDQPDHRGEGLGFRCARGPRL